MINKLKDLFLKKAKGKYLNLIRKRLIILDLLT